MHTLRKGPPPTTHLSRRHLQEKRASFFNQEQERKDFRNKALLASALGLGASAAALPFARKLHLSGRPTRALSEAADALPIDFFTSLAYAST